MEGRCLLEILGIYLHFLFPKDKFILQVESLTNQEEVELRTKIEALGLEVTKVPSKSLKQLDEVSMITFHIHSLHIYLFNCASISMKKWILPNI